MKKTVFITIAAALVFALCSCAFNFDLVNDKPLHRDEETEAISGTPLALTTEEAGGTSFGVPDLPDLPGMNSEWPDNELTRLVPDPGFKVKTVSEEDGEFGAVFSGVTADQMRAYAEKLKKAGFNVDAEVVDNSYMGIEVYSYNASNADGVSVSLSVAAGVASMAVSKP